MDADNVRVTGEIVSTKARSSKRYGRHTSVSVRLSRDVLFWFPYYNQDEKFLKRGDQVTITGDKTGQEGKFTFLTNVKVLGHVPTNCQHQMLRKEDTMYVCANCETPARVQLMEAVA